MRADGDARAGTCGKLWAAFWLKLADFSTFYRFQQLRSTAAEAIFHFSGSPNWYHQFSRTTKRPPWEPLLIKFELEIQDATNCGK